MAKSKEQRAGYEDLASIIGGNCGDAIRALLADLEAAESEVATLRQQLAASDAALIESRANDREAMRQLAEAQARIAELSAMLDHKTDEADEAEWMLMCRIAELERAG